MIPICYSPTETAFTNNGIGACADAVSCTVVQELNGKFELELELPATSKRLSEISTGYIILAKPNNFQQTQPFRIYRITKRSNRTVTLYAQHISYDLDGLPVSPFTAQNGLAAMSYINQNQIIQGQPFQFGTEMTTANVGTMTVETPTAIRKLLGDGENTLLGTYGGVLHFDRFNVVHLISVGQDRGFIIAYGKNLVDMEQENNIAEMYNAVLPYVTINGVTYSGSYVMAPGTWAYYRVLTVDFSSEWTAGTAPSAQDFSNMANAYIAREHVGEPEISIRVTTVPPGSEGLETIDQMALGDIVKVRFQSLGINDVPTNVVATTYDVLREQYTSIDLGKRPRSAAEAISDARRLTRGEIPTARIGGGSIGGGKLKDAAITEGKIRGNAVTYDKLALAVQSLFVDIIEANEIYSSVISAARGISCSTIVVSGQQYLPGYWTFVDGLGNDKTFYGLKKAGT